MTTIQQIKSIISPVRVLKAKEDWLKVAEIVNPDNTRNGLYNSTEAIAINLISRYESLKSQPLSKEMFVEPEQPKYKSRKGEPREEFSKDLELEAAWQLEKKKIWFEGFEEISKNVFSNGQVEFMFIGTDVRMNLKGEGSKATYDIPVSTIHDVAFHIDFYNRTASKPVEINVTDSFIQELIK